MAPTAQLHKEETEMNRTILTAIAVIAGLAVLSGIGFTSVASTASPPVPEGGPLAPTRDTSNARENDGGFALAGAWTFEGKADLHDSGALELNVRSTAGVPRAFELVRRLLVGRDVLLVNTRVRIADVNGHAVALSRLNDAILRVKGTLLPAGQWRYDLDGEATPTVRVSRIIVLGLDLD
jgi:hypothetical protein